MGEEEKRKKEKKRKVWNRDQKQVCIPHIYIPVSLNYAEKEIQRC